MAVQMHVNKRSSAHAVISAVVLSGPLLPHTGAAQSADPAVTGPIEELVISATRVERENFTAPTPVTSLTGEEIAAKAPTTLGDVLAQIPSFRATNSPTTSGVNSRGGGLVTADLRALGPSRTLVLVDGRRFVPSTDGGVVDLKLIPTLLVDHVEAVTGGASAAWGSDAVAGVVNFRLKDAIDGATASVQYGISEEGDNEEWKAAFAAGSEFADGRGRFVVGGDYLKNEGVESQYTRRWGRGEVGLLSNASSAVNGLPNFIIAPNVHFATATPGGLIASGPLRGTAFGPGGVPYAFSFGPTFGTSMTGGTVEGLTPSLSTDLSVPLESVSVLARATFDATNAFAIFTELSGATSKTTGRSQQPRDFALAVQRDNAYLPTSVRDAMASAGLQTITVGRVSEDSGRVEVEGNNRTVRGVLGARGSISDDWSWDAYVQFGRNRYELDTGPNNRINANWLRAIDAVAGPQGVMCRSTLTSPSNGCVPINIFGDGSVSALNPYVYGTAWFNLETEQSVAAANLRGDAFATWAGPISLALGAEYRKEEALGESDPLSQQPQANGSIGAWVLGNQLPLEGEYHLWEAYAEAVAPLASEQRWAKALDLNGAVRRTDYSTSGAVTTWKVGIGYQPIDDLRFRATRSRDIRAPNLSELYQAGGSSFTNVFDPALNQSVQVRQVAQGNLELEPEISDGISAGLVYTPHFIEGASISVDYFKIEMEEIMGTLSAPVIANGCFAGNTVLCDSIVFNSNGSINFIVSRTLNLAELSTSGVDLELAYRQSGYNARVFATYVDELTTVNQSGTTKLVGQLSQFNRLNGMPHWQGAAEFGYGSGSWSANLQARYIGAGKYSTQLREGAGAANTINDNTVPSFVYWSALGKYGFSFGATQLEVFAVINNLFDKAPPMIPSGAAGFTNESSTNATFYDVIGRAYKLGVRMQF